MIILDYSGRPNIITSVLVSRRRVRVRKGPVVKGSRDQNDVRLNWGCL
jgi:hypothetical protein